MLFRNYTEPIKPDQSALPGMLHARLESSSLREERGRTVDELFVFFAVLAGVDAPKITQVLVFVLKCF